MARTNALEQTALHLRRGQIVRVGTTQDINFFKGDALAEVRKAGLAKLTQRVRYRRISLRARKEIEEREFPVLG